MNWPDWPFKFSTGEPCQLGLGHEKRGEREHRFEQAFSRHPLPNGGCKVWSYKLLTETARPPPRKRGRR